MALIKDTSFGHRGNGELAILQFRAEFFNIFNEVNFGLPSNIVRGSGFGRQSADRRPIAADPILTEIELLTLPARDAIVKERGLARPLVSVAVSLVGLSLAKRTARGD